MIRRHHYRESGLTTSTTITLCLTLPRWHFFLISFPTALHDVWTISSDYVEPTCSISFHSSHPSNFYSICTCRLCQMQISSSFASVSAIRSITREREIVGGSARRGCSFLSPCGVASAAMSLDVWGPIDPSSSCRTRRWWGNDIYELRTELLVFPIGLSQVSNVVSLIPSPGSSRMPFRGFTDVLLEVDKKMWDAWCGTLCVRWSQGVSMKRMRNIWCC